jgi:hypothetical protein
MPTLSEYRTKLAIERAAARALLAAVWLGSISVLVTWTALTFDKRLNLGPTVS